MNYPTVEPPRDAVLRALRLQVKKKQTLELTESEAKNLMGSGLTLGGEWSRRARHSTAPTASGSTQQHEMPGA